MTIDEMLARNPVDDWAIRARWINDTAAASTRRCRWQYDPWLVMTKTAERYELLYGTLIEMEAE